MRAELLAAGVTAAEADRLVARAAAWRPWAFRLEGLLHAGLGLVLMTPLLWFLVARAPGLGASPVGKHRGDAGALGVSLVGAWLLAGGLVRLVGGGRGDEREPTPRPAEVLRRWGLTTLRYAAAGVAFVAAIMAVARVFRV